MGCALGVPGLLRGQMSQGAGSPNPGRNTGVAPPTEPSPLGEVQASDAIVKGSVTMVGNGISVMSGASITSVKGAATLRLRRGGEVRVCAPTTLTITSSKNERELLMSMNVGSVETHYTRPAGADSIVTPDFRLLLAGPGTFHFALSADIRGTTCLRTLPGNSSSIIVSELSGEGVYQLRPQELVVFREGRMSDSSTQAPAGCGCPAASSAVPAAAGSASLAGTPGGITGTGLEANTGAVPATRPGETRVEVDVPFVFRGGAPADHSSGGTSGAPSGGAARTRGAPAKLMSAGGTKPVPCELLSPLLPAWECRAMVALNRPPSGLPKPGPAQAGAPASHAGSGTTGVAKAASPPPARTLSRQAKIRKTASRKTKPKKTSPARATVSARRGQKKKSPANPLDLKRFKPLKTP